MAAKVPPLATRKPVYKTLPKGEVRFSQLERPDTTFSDERPSFNLTLVYTEEEIKPIRDMLDGLADEWLGQVASETGKKNLSRNDIPIRPDTDREGNETGLWRLSLRSDAYRLSTDPVSGEKVRELRKIPMFDSKNNPVDRIRCYGGAIVAPAVVVSFYAAANPKIGIGIKLGIQALQVVKASNGERGAAAYGFQPQEESDVDDASQEVSVSPGEDGEDL